MKHNFDDAMRWIGLSEGGYVNHPDDPGGATDRGITQRTYDAWNKAQGLPQKPVRGISKATAEEILAEQYFAPVWFDRLPDGLDYAMADYAVNSGPARAVKELQRILGVAVDGVMGAETFGAVQDHDAERLIEELCQRRMDFLRRLHHWPTFGKGWTRRVMGEQTGFQNDDIGVIDRAIMLAEAEPHIPRPTVIGEGKAPEPEKQGTDGPAVAVTGGAVSAAGAALSSASGLHPVAQAILIGGALVAAVALFVLWQRGKLNKVAL
jgi:lysozyme family protein